ncbi:hypothetical protein [Azospirillum isscasi]|uniref:Uncharacterized protein n=1 Tax=Azospirillum isscasi TaxID=3053926 RepID=A0ABU0WFJ7_9PROT|nr:hypothetical protein [Azospirillum isscasi]MDQ2102980.1 hypothetical protein [Azospirillum isscasi]
MSDVRKDLLRQMKAIRERMDPKLLERAKLSVFGKVPYDRDSAKEAVGHFLDSKDDGGAFRRKLEDALRKDGAPLDLPADAGGGDALSLPGPAEPAPPRKPRRLGRLV